MAKKRFNPRAFALRDWQHQCQHCGRWTLGAFRGRQDVPLAEVNALYTRIVGKRIRGHEAPALRYPEHTRYVETGTEPHSGGTCDDCNREINEEQMARIEAMDEPIRSERLALLEAARERERKKEEARRERVARGDEAPSPEDAARADEDGGEE